MRHRPYVIFVHPFDPYSGGNIALYALAGRLREQGEKVAIWPEGRPASPRVTGFHSADALRRYLADRRRYRPGLPGMDLPIARWGELKDAITVYPETIRGNPLRAGHVVRWFLHRPGYWTGVVEYGRGELYFFYQDAFNDETVNPDPSNRLSVTWVNPVYKQVNFGERSGTCYLLRKGAARATDVDRSRAIVVDDMPHAEMAATFNRCENLVSYDLYSLYSIYAAICGCTPIIVPEPGLSREEWFPDAQDRLGLAYGWDEGDHARATRAALVEKLAGDRAREDEMVRLFIAKSQAKFR